MYITLYGGPRDGETVQLREPVPEIFFPAGRTIPSMGILVPKLTIAKHVYRLTSSRRAEYIGIQ